MYFVNSMNEDAMIFFEYLTKDWAVEKVTKVYSKRLLVKRFEIVLSIILPDFLDHEITKEFIIF